MKLCRTIEITLVIFLVALRAIAEPGRNNSTACFDLTDACEEWQPGFADYPAGQEMFYELTAQCASDPTNLNRGFFLSGANHSDDLFMFIKHPVCGLKPSGAYEVEAWVRILSKAPTGCIGVGGDPGAGVYVKFGASAIEPAPVLQPDGRLRMNVDIGQQSNSGSNAVVIGDIATGITDCFNEEYEAKELQTAASLAAQADENGTLWIFAGTDSGFEGRTSLFFTRVHVHMHHTPTEKNQTKKKDKPENSTHDGSGNGCNH